MSGEQPTNMKDVKTSIEFNASIMETMLQMLQGMQTQNFKMEKRFGVLESEMSSLGNKFTTLSEAVVNLIDQNTNSSSSFPQCNGDISKEDFKRCLTESALDVKSFVKDEIDGIACSNQAQTANSNSIAEKLLCRMDLHKLSQAKHSASLGKVTAEILGLKEIDEDMSNKLSGLIRCSAHGNIKVYQELFSLTSVAEKSSTKLSSQIRIQTNSLKKAQESVKEEMVDELSSLNDKADLQIGQLSDLKAFTDQQLPHTDQMMLRDEMIDTFQALKEVSQAQGGHQGEHVVNSVFLHDQCSLLQSYLNQSLKDGELWCLIDVIWFKQWKKYVGFDEESSNNIDDSSNPGPIDNTPILNPVTKVLRDGLVDDLDYVLLPEVAFDRLSAWYGIMQDQVPIVRRVIMQGMYVKHCKVEVYLLELRLCQHSDTDTFITHSFSRADTIETIENKMRLLFNIGEAKNVRLWNRYMSKTYEHLNKNNISLQDAGLYICQLIIIEIQNEDATWPRIV